MSPRPPDVSTLLDWVYRVNISATEGTTLIHRQRLALEIKTNIIGGGAGWTDGSGIGVSPPNVWSVVASSDSVAADGSDRWNNLDDLVWDTTVSARSWCVLRHADYFGLADPLEILLDCSEAANHDNATLGIYISRAGFGVGAPSTTARPTATDEVKVNVEGGTPATASWQGGAVVDGNHRAGIIHFMMTSDGMNINIFICRMGACPAWWSLFRMEEWVDTSVTIPAALMVMSDDVDVNIITWPRFQSEDYAQWNASDTGIGGAFTMRPYMQVEGSGDSEASSKAASNIGGITTSGFHPVQLHGNAPASGTIATVPDLWWGRAALDTESYPGDGSAIFQQFGVAIVPWNGSPALFS